MKEQIDSLLEKNRVLDPFYANNDFAKCLREFDTEWSEVKQSVEEGIDNLDEELGDMYRDICLLIQKAEDEWKIQPWSAFESIYTKMSKRKSFLLEEREVTKEEAQDIRNKAKTAEGKGNLWDDVRDVS